MSIPYDNKAIILDFEGGIEPDETNKILAPFLPEDSDAFLKRASNSREAGNTFEFVDHGTVFLYELGVAIVYPSLTQLERQLEINVENPINAKRKLLAGLGGVRNASLDQPTELCSSWTDSVSSTWGMQATKVDLSPYDGAGVKIGIIDSGVDFQDADLTSNVVEKANFALHPSVEITFQLSLNAIELGIMIYGMR